MQLKNAVCLSIALALMAGAAPIAAVAAEEPLEVRITIKEHRFEPAKIEVPAGRALKLVVTNSDATPEEFESNSLRIERVIPAGKVAEFTIRPLSKNKTYKFFGEFHKKSAQGELVVK